jgi:hypothetical protein
VKPTIIATAFAAALLLGACAPNQPAPVASTPVPSAGSSGIISGPAPMPSPRSMADSAPNYTQVGRDPVPNFPDTALGSPDDLPYGSY